MKLKRKWVFVLGILFSLLLQITIETYINTYNDYFKECDELRGYTCNVFGK